MFKTLKKNPPPKMIRFQEETRVKVDDQLTRSIASRYCFLAKSGLLAGEKIELGEKTGRIQSYKNCSQSFKIRKNPPIFIQPLHTSPTTSGLPNKHSNQKNK